MGYAISLNLILEPETSDVEHVARRALGHARSTAIIWAIPEVSRQPELVAEPSAPTCRVPVMLVGGMTGKTVLPSIAHRQRRDRTPGH